jgi:hypothetical protein
MRAIDAIRARKPSATGRLAGDIRRAFLACGIVVALCIVAVIANWSQASTTSQIRTPSEANLSTGSMLVVSPGGDLCRERTIDNSTWRIKNKGWVDCDEALARAANSGADLRKPGSRLELIREGFRGKP